MKVKHFRRIAKCGEGTSRASDDPQDYFNDEETWKEKISTSVKNDRRDPTVLLDENLKDVQVNAPTFL